MQEKFSLFKIVLIENVKELLDAFLSTVTNLNDFFETTITIRSLRDLYNNAEVIIIAFIYENPTIII